MAENSNREALARFLLRLRSGGIADHRILSAFEAIPRRNFVPVIYGAEAYAPGQMPIECGQSMTDITRVALTLKAVRINPGDRVLELGTGTGYQSALLSHMAAKVVTLERFRTLHDKAAARLSQLGITNIVAKLQDGSGGGTELGVHDRIIANFSFQEIPRFFIDNIASNGMMIAPIGPPDSQQIMKRFTKIGSRLQVEDFFPVRVQPAISGVSNAI